VDILNAGDGVIESDMSGARVRLRGAVDEANLCCALASAACSRMSGLPGTREWRANWQSGVLRCHAHVVHVYGLAARRGERAKPPRALTFGARTIAEPALLLRQPQLSHLLQPILDAAGDHAEDHGQLDLHRHRRVEHVDDAGDGLTRRPDAESEPVALPAFAAGAAAAGKLVDDFPKPVSMRRRASARPSWCGMLMVIGVAMCRRVARSGAPCKRLCRGR
jgi:hypothetical protein